MHLQDHEPHRHREDRQGGQGRAQPEPRPPFGRAGFLLDAHPDRRKQVGIQRRPLRGHARHHPAQGVHLFARGGMLMQIGFQEGRIVL